MWPFDPATRAGVPGSVTPARSSPGSPVTRSRAGSQTAGTPRSRCMSLAISATPDFVCAPATAQLLLPSALGSAPDSATAGPGNFSSRGYIGGGGAPNPGANPPPPVGRSPPEPTADREEQSGHP